MQSLQKRFTLPFVTCPDHPNEVILNINMEVSDKPLMCIKCLSSKNIKTENAESIVGLITEIQRFDKKSAEMSPNVKKPIPDDIAGFRDNKERTIEEIRALTETSKEKIAKLIQDELEKAANTYKELKLSYFEALDENIAVLEALYSSFESHIKVITGVQEPRIDYWTTKLEQVNGFDDFQIFCISLKNEVKEMRTLFDKSHGEQLNQLQVNGAKISDANKKIMTFANESLTFLQNHLDDISFISKLQHNHTLFRNKAKQ